MMIIWEETNAQVTKQTRPARRFTFVANSTEITDKLGSNEAGSFFAQAEN